MMKKYRLNGAQVLSFVIGHSDFIIPLAPSVHHGTLPRPPMRCPKCGSTEDKVIDSREAKDGSSIRRRRECQTCWHRFTTYEMVEHEDLMVVKRNEVRQSWDRA